MAKLERINYKLIEDVKHNEFTYNGERWTLDTTHEKNQGFSPSGIWNDMRSESGDKFARVYKADVLKADAKKAIALFN